MQKNRGLLSILAGLGLLLLTVGCALMQQKSTPYEVWAADQNDNKIYVLDPEGKTLKTIDGATPSDPTCSGAYPRIPMCTLPVRSPIPSRC